MTRPGAPVRVARGLLRVLRVVSDVVAGAYVAVTLVVSVRSLPRWDMVSLAGSGVVVGIMAVTCVACVRPVRPFVYARVGALCAAASLGLAGLFALGAVYATVGGVLAAGGAAIRARNRGPGGSWPPRQGAGSPRTSTDRAGEVRTEPGDERAPGRTCDVELEQVDLVVEDVMTDLDLCRAWCSSYVALERAGPASRAGIATTRRALLDELERRHPEAVQAWLRAGARAASSPERYLLGPVVRDFRPSPPSSSPT